MNNRILLFVFILMALSFESALTQEYNWISPQNVQILNTSGDDFAPSWNKFENKLYFNSTELGYSAFYTSELNDDASFKPPQYVKGPLNKANDNRSYISFLDSKTAYLSAFHLTPKRSYLNIAKSMVQRNAWSEPYIIDELASDNFSAHPTISPDGLLLVFSSDRKSKNGDPDLYMSIKNDAGAWSEPIALDELNSPGNEITPCFFSENILVFASDGLGGPGGYDLYYSERIDGRWQRPMPVTGVNTEFDESDFTFLPNGSALFASNRPGGKGGLDIYIAEFERNIPNNDSIGDPEISLKAYVESIKIKNIFDYLMIQCPTAFIVEKSSSEPVFNYYETPYANKLTCSNIYDMTTSVLGERLSADTSQKLRILLNSKYERKAEFITGFKHFLNAKFGIEESCLEFKETEIKESGVNEFIAAKFESNSSTLLSPISIGKTRIEQEPANLDLVIESRPANFFKSWNCHVRLNETTTGKRLSGLSSPGKIKIDLNDIKYDMNKFDSLVVDCEFVDKNGAKYLKTINFKINKSEIKQLKVVSNKIYEFPILAGLGYSFKTKEPILKQLKSLAPSIKNIYVDYFESNLGSGKELANQTKATLLEDNIGIATIRKKDASFADSPAKDASKIVKVILELK